MNKYWGKTKNTVFVFTDTASDGNLFTFSKTSNFIMLSQSTERKRWISFSVQNQLIRSEQMNRGQK